MTVNRTNLPIAVPAGSNPLHTGAQPRTIQGSAPDLRSLVSRLLQGTPGRMRLLALVGVIAALALGAAAANAILGSKAAVERAANNTQQVVRMQSIHVALLRADALATNAFLVGGLEPATTRAQYDAAMADVASSIAEGAAAQPADGKALGALSEAVQTYAALVEQARSNNRLGLPVGARYLTTASDGLRADAIPIVAQLVSTNEARSNAEFDRSNSSLQLLVGVAALIVLVLLAVWLARRTHRYVNRSLTGGMLLLLAGLIVAFTTIGGVGAATSQVASGDYRQAVELAHLRTAANDARANESLTLIKRGSDKANEQAWQADSKLVSGTLANVDDSQPLSGAWDAYVAAHKQIRTLDDNGQWEQAVKLATSTEAQGATATFDAFDQSVSQQRDTASRATIETLDGLGGTNTLWAVVIAIAALVASWLIVRGFGQRIEEYR